MNAGERYEAQTIEVRGAGHEVAATSTSMTGNFPETFVFAGLPPVFIVLIGNYVTVTLVIPRVPTDYLATIPAVPLQSLLSLVFGQSSIALVVAFIVLVLLNWRRFNSIKSAMSEGTSNSVLPTLNTASLVGFGTVIASLPGFADVRDIILGVLPENPLISLAIAVNALTGMTGLRSGGMSIALETLGRTYLKLGNAARISRDLLHRITAISTGGLDALPHIGAVVTLLSICGLTHKESYFDIFIVAVVFPLLALAVVIVLGPFFGSF